MFELLTIEDKSKYTSFVLLPALTSGYIGERAYHRALVIGNEIFITGGWNGVAQIGELRKYVPSNHSVVLLRNGQQPLQRHSHVIFVDNAIANFYSVYGAGDSTKNSYGYVRLSDNYCDGPFPFSTQFLRQEAAYGGIGQYGYIFSGWGPNNNILQDVVKWTIGTQTFATMSTANVPAGRRGSMSTVIGSNLYVLGGSLDVAATQLLNDFHVLNTSTGLWTKLANFPTKIRHAAMCELNGKIYVHGGVNETSMASSDVHVYNPATNVWTKILHNLDYGRCGHVAGGVNGSVYFFGGLTASGQYKSDFACLTP